MQFIFCDKSINTGANFQQVEGDIYVTVSYFHGYHDRNGYEN